MQAETGRLRVIPPEDSERLAINTADAPSPGRFIREQRKRRGMSIEQLAAATKIPRASLELLEDDRYDALPGPVFAKGFLRCAARAVGLDVQTVMDLLYERERAALSARRRPLPAIPAPSAVVSGEAEPVRHAAPRVRARVGAEGGLTRRIRDRLPNPTVFLWVVVAAFVAMVVLAAFNLVGGSPGSGAS